MGEPDHDLTRWHEPQDDAEGFAAKLGEPEGDRPPGGEFTARERHASR